MNLGDRLARICGKQVTRLSPLPGGCVADVFRADFVGGATLVIKTGGSSSGLGCEGQMLRYLNKNTALPVPAVIHCEDDLLVMSYIPSDEPSGGPLAPLAQEHAADLIAQLHGISTSHFGFDTNTVIGGLPQPNLKYDQWIDFFRDQRLIFMGQQALKANKLPVNTMIRLEKFAGTLEEKLSEPTAPSLIHGDLWGGNILRLNDKITGLIDPAIYFAHAEIELAFSTLFSTFDEPFFKRYQEHRPIEPGFFEERCDIYNLYPLLVHVRLFGDHYVSQVERTLTRFGF